MHQREQETCARERRKIDTLEDIAAEIRAARDLTWAGWLAAQTIGGEDADAIGALFDAVAKRLDEVATAAERAMKARAEASQSVTA